LVVIQAITASTLAETSTTTTFPLGIPVEILVVKFPPSISRVVFWKKASSPPLMKKAVNQLSTYTTTFEAMLMSARISPIVTLSRSKLGLQN